MQPYTLPPPLVDPNTLPPAILTSEPGSFAHNTLKTRVPAILREAMVLNDYPVPITGALEAFYAELTCGIVRGLNEDTPDRQFWDAASAAWIGRSWLDVPWYWAEAFFYRRVLEATRYFRSGVWQGVDPYGAKKAAEWAPDVAPRAVASLLADLPAEPEGRFARLLHASLWGNRTDLSYTVAAHLGATAGPEAERANLLVDDTGALWDYLRNGHKRVALIADNAGTELLMDLALIDGLLGLGLAGEVHMHLKPQPYFVSDAMETDVMAGLDALSSGAASARALATRLRTHISAGRLVLTTHWFYATSLFYYQLPADLLNDLRAADLVIVKGDANYRRLLGDAHWPHTSAFAAATAYFPAPLAALRTFKSELAVGLPEGASGRLDALDPDWLVNGVRGVIQAKLG